VRIVQLNLAVASDRIEAWPVRRDRVAALLTDEAADVLIAQAGTPEAIDAMMAACPTFRHVEVHDGLSVLSKMPITGRQVVSMSRRAGTDDPFERALLSVNIDDVRIVNAHMSWVVEQAEDNARALTDHLDATPGDILVIGDLNQEPSSNAIQYLQRAGLVDCWARVCHGQSGYTYPADAPTTRIDYVLLRSSSRRIANMRLVGATPRLSDHLGIVADLVA
jgi:endonuclease/exonuclease/phosphatase family metal-dependent hydrolase